MTTTLFDTWKRDHASDFAAGVRLLTAHNPGAVTRAILSRLQTLATTGDYVGRYEWGKLEYALQRSPSPETAPSLIVTRPQAAVPVPEQVQQQHGSAMTSDRAKELHKEHAHVHALMVSATTDAERAKYAADIMQRIIPALDAEYDRLRALEQVLQGMEEADQHAPTRPILNKSDASAFKKLQSVRSRISTLRKKLQKEKDPDKKARWERELEAKITERERLENELS